MGLELQKGATELVDSIIATCWTAQNEDIWTMRPTGYS